MPKYLVEKIETISRFIAVTARDEQSALYLAQTQRGTLIQSTPHEPSYRQPRPLDEEMDVQDD
ncbi:MAG: hypothetical protein RL497_2068 [Pseudomonadota bacterium]|jgi:hypothetical protein